MERTNWDKARETVEAAASKVTKAIERVIE